MKFRRQFNRTRMAVAARYTRASFVFRNEGGRKLFRSEAHFRSVRWFTLMFAAETSVRKLHLIMKLLDTPQSAIKNFR